MAQVIFNPDEARHFASLLEHHSEQLRFLDSRTSAALVNLHAKSWQDAKYQQFQKKYEAASLLIQRFREHSAKYAEYLRRKASLIDRYLDGSG